MARHDYYPRGGPLRRPAAYRVRDKIPLFAGESAPLRTNHTRWVPLKSACEFCGLSAYELRETLRRGYGYGAVAPANRTLTAGEARLFSLEIGDTHHRNSLIQIDAIDVCRFMADREQFAATYLNLMEFAERIGVAAQSVYRSRYRAIDEGHPTGTIWNIDLPAFSTHPLWHQSQVMFCAVSECVAFERRVLAMRGLTHPMDEPA